MNNEDLTYMNSCANEYYEGLDNEKKRSYIKSMLNHDPMKVKFTKVNGDEREMFCTLTNEYIPEDKVYGDGSARKKNMDVLAVFDIEKRDWRSFRIENVVDFAIVRTEDLNFQVETNIHYQDVPF